jgi:hypothetical protein
MILALESSCDETAVALFDPLVGLTGEWIHSQIALQEQYGGVVPDLATREHLRNFGPLLTQAKNSAGCSAVSEIAVTQGPGLAACLALGLALAIWSPLRAQSAQPMDMMDMKTKMDGKMTASCQDMLAKKAKMTADMKAQDADITKILTVVGGLQQSDGHPSP